MDSILITDWTILPKAAARLGFVQCFLKEIVEYYKKSGFITAIDDFGSGYSGLGLLADFQTNIVKFDMALIRNIDKDASRQSIIRHSLNLFKDLNIIPLGNL